MLEIETVERNIIMQVNFYYENKKLHCCRYRQNWFSSFSNTITHWNKKKTSKLN